MRQNAADVWPIGRAGKCAIDTSAKLEARSVSDQPREKMGAISVIFQLARTPTRSVARPRRYCAPGAALFTRGSSASVDDSASPPSMHRPMRQIAAAVAADGSVRHYPPDWSYAAQQRRLYGPRLSVLFALCEVPGFIYHPSPWATPRFIPRVRGWGASGRPIVDFRTREFRRVVTFPGAPKARYVYFS